MNSINWTEKHRPKYFSDIKGQEESIERIKNFIYNFNKKKIGKNVLVFNGPPGIGKTAMAYVAANETNSEIFELNASDLRSKEKLKEILKPATEQKSLLKKGKVILIDEIDGISESDYGGLKLIVNLIDTISFPLIMTSNDIWGKKFSDLRKKAEIITFKELDYKLIKNILIETLRKEKKFVVEDILTNLSINAQGDVRAALNDLQIIATLPDSSEVLIYERNKESDIFNVLRIIFKEKTNNSVLKLFDSVNKPIDEIFLWVEENIPYEYQGIELVKAYDFLSKADIFKKRIYYQQYWRFLLYINAFLSYGVSSSKRFENKKFTSYKRPTRVLKIWLNNRRIEKKKSISKKYALHVHVGEKRALKEFPTIKQFLLNPSVQKELKLTEEEIEYLNK